MGLDRGGCQPERARNLLVRPPLSNEFEHVGLAQGQLIEDGLIEWVRAELIRAVGKA